MPLFKCEGRKVAYEAPKAIPPMSDRDLASEYDLSWTERDLKTHRAISSEIARRDPQARRATPRDKLP